MSLKADERYYIKLKAAYYCLEKGMIQADVAQMLNVSRTTLNKLLKEAREEGMVKVEIVDRRNMKQAMILEDRLCEQYHLQAARVVNPIVDDAEEINRVLAVAGAQYIENEIQSGMRIGIAWGRTLEMMSELLTEDHSITGLEVITLIGGAGTADSIIQPGLIVERLLRKYGGTGYIINAPYICQTEELCASIKQEPHIADALNRSKHADLTLIGIGEKPELSTSYASYYRYSPEIINKLIERKAVGDICANFFDINGRLCDTPVSRRIVSINIEDLRSHKKVIALGGGPNKHDSVLGALSGGYVDVLITDQFTAEAVLGRASK